MATPPAARRPISRRRRVRTSPAATASKTSPVGEPPTRDLPRMRRSGSIRASPGGAFVNICSRPASSVAASSSSCGLVLRDVRAELVVGRLPIRLPWTFDRALHRIAGTVPLHERCIDGVGHEVNFFRLPGAQPFEQRLEGLRGRGDLFGERCSDRRRGRRPRSQ